MKNRLYTVIISFLLVNLLFSAASAFGQDIKERMKARRPMIKELKAKGIVGEDAKGFLQFVGQKKEKEDVVAAENVDRKKVYKAIAKQQKSTAEHVGKRRALKIAKNAKTGTWLQKQSGEWYQKE
jgi:uncharacterized protein YdbL (DUF1318 family)